jgi:hypothetical protein
MLEDLDIKEYTDPRHNPMILYYVAGSGQQPCRIEKIQQTKEEVS